jgi:hypothetical protein
MRALRYCDDESGVNPRLLLCLPHWTSRGTDVAPKPAAAYTAATWTWNRRWWMAGGLRAVQPQCWVASNINDAVVATSGAMSCADAGEPGGRHMPSCGLAFGAVLTVCWDVPISSRFSVTTRRAFVNAG